MPLHKLRSLTLCLLLVGACGDETTVQSDPSTSDDDDADDSNDTPNERLDAGRAADAAGGRRPDAAAADGGRPADVGRVDGSVPDAAARDGATPPPPTGSSLKPKCVTKDSQVTIFGDSYINWPTHAFGPQLADYSKQNWRMYAVGGWSMGSGGLGLIPTQLDSAIADDKNFHTVVMDGGGNDVLLADPGIDLLGACKTPSAPKDKACQTIIDKAIAAADKMLTKASANGVRDVVYFFYPHVPKGTLLGGEDPNFMLDFAMPQINKFCDGIAGKTNGKTRCTFIDMVPVFSGHDDWFFPGDIHPTAAGSGPMAKKVWDTMKAACIGQPASSGCCEP